MHPFIIALAILSFFFICAAFITATQSSEWVNIKFNRQCGNKKLWWGVSIFCYLYYALYAFIATPLFLFITFMPFLFPKAMGMVVRLVEYDTVKTKLICWGQLEMIGTEMEWSLALCGTFALGALRAVYLFQDAAVHLRKGEEIHFAKLRLPWQD